MIAMTLIVAAAIYVGGACSAYFDTRNLSFALGWPLRIVA